MANNASARWTGDLRAGTGTFTAGDSLRGDYSFKSRFEDGDGVNPEQLIGAAHAACFSMALANILADGGHPPVSVETDARVAVRFVDGNPTITSISLRTVGRVPGLSDDAFRLAAELAKDGCVVSRALAGVDEITLTAALAADAAMLAVDGR
jgi:osmotically inducible protein OsmC